MSSRINEPRPSGSGTVRPLLSRRNPQRAHLPVEIAAFEAKQLRGAAYIAVRFLQLLEDVFAFGGLPHILQTPVPFRGPFLGGLFHGVQRNVPRIDPALRRSDERR